MNKRMRVWTSGCVAVVSLALAGHGESWACDEADMRSGRLQTSRHDLTLTLHRLQAFAPRHGLTVMAHWTPRIEADLQRDVVRLDRQPRSVLVFAGKAGGTPVLMFDDRARPDVPLSLHLRTRSDGVVEVMVPALHRFDGDELPAELARDITSLPALVMEAVG